MKVLSYEGFLKKPVRIAFLGDIMCEKAVLPSVEKSDPFYYVRGILSSADYVVGGLETTLCGTTTDYPRFSSANSLVDLLARDINALFTANNHANDYGKTGIEKTINALKDYPQSGIQLEGEIPSQISEKINGHKITMLGYTQFLNRSETSDKNVNSADEVLGMVSFFDQNAVKQIENAKASSDIVIVSIHCDKNVSELSRKSTKAQRDFLEKIVDIGADLVLGAHPHYFQGGEILSEKEAIVYSLGNFFTNMYNPPQYTINSGCALIVDLDQYSNMSLQFLPVFTVKNPEDGFYYVIPSFALTNGTIKWIPNKDLEKLLGELDRTKKTLADCGLMEYNQ